MTGKTEEQKKVRSELKIKPDFIRKFDWKEEKYRRVVFIGLVAISFLLILIYNAFTPMMTDDLTYKENVLRADSLWDLIHQEVYQYRTWTGRSVNHMLLRLFLLGDKWFFNICNSLAFVALTLFMYGNVEHKKRYDGFVYLLINLFLWVFAVSFEQTVLWQTGACNYLWGSMMIMGYLTVFRYCMKNDYDGVYQMAPAVGLLLLGILSGWCNENTSGGCILLTVIGIGFYLWKNKRIRIWMITALAGNLIGFLFMVLAPGNANRAQYMEEEHTGLFALISRWQKCNLAIRNHFFVLIAIAVVVFILVRLQKAKWERSRNMLIYFFVFIATCYALVLAPEPMGRAYFGAGIFLIISCVQGIVDVSDMDLYLRALKLSAVSILGLYFLFDYMDCGAHLMRIYRESQERFRYIEEQKAAGNTEITVPLLRPAFQNKYSDAYNSDLSAEDSGYWVNVAYATYFHVDSISAMPREEWEEWKVRNEGKMGEADETIPDDSHLHETENP